MFSAEYNITSWAARGLFWMALFSAVGVLSASAAGRETKHQQVPDFRCSPKRLYRGDTLQVMFLGPRDRCDLSVFTADVHDMIVSYQPRPGDKFGPVISHEALGKMKLVNLSTITAQGSPFEYKHAEIPPIVDPPQAIFTKEGNYELLIGENLRKAKGDFAACSVYYYDCARPARENSRLNTDTGEPH